MRRSIAVAVSTLGALLCLPSAAHAKAEVTLSGNAIRVPGAAGTKNRSVWARRRSLVLVLPPMALSKRVVMPSKHPLVRGLRVHSYNNRTEVEVRLLGRAEAMMARVRFVDDGRDLLMRLAPAKVALPAALTTPAAKAAEPKARPAADNAATATDKPPAKRRAKAKPTASKKAAHALAGAQRKAKKPSWMQNKRNKDKGGSSATSLVAGLLLAIGAAVGWFFMRKRKGKGGLDPHIDIIASRTLAAKRRLVLVEVSGELMLLGVSEKGIELLRSVKRAEADDQAAETFFARGFEMDAIAEAAAREAEPAVASATSFLSRLEAEMADRQAPARAATAAPPPAVPETSPAPQPAAAPRSTAAPSPATPAPAAAPRRSADVLHDEASPLDEAWAERVLQMRRARERGEAISLDNASTSSSAYGSSAGAEAALPIDIDSPPRILH